MPPKNYTQQCQSFFFIALIVQLLCSCNKRAVSLVIHNANIFTADSGFTVKQAIAIANGVIVDAGTNKEILSQYKADRVVDAQGKFIYPGLIDAHCHFTGYATDMWKCDVTGTSSFAEIVEKIKQYSKESSTEWLYGRGWDQNDWTVKEFPDKTQLDILFPNRPVFLKRIDGHAALANQKALDIAGVNLNTQIEGGRVEVINGQLTGILIDNAMDLVEKKIPLIEDEAAKNFFSTAQEKCFAYGITGVHDCGVSEHTIELLEQAYNKGSLHMKVFALLSDSAAYYDTWIRKGVYKKGKLHVGGFKLYADGALGSRGACLLQPYTDKPGWKGFLLNSQAHFEAIAAKLAGTDFQICTHAIGDSANRTILGIYAAVLKGKNDKRWRIEHAQAVDASDTKMFGQYNIIPSVQPTHATSDMYWAGERLGNERLKTAYIYKTLLGENGWMPLGTDFPVEDINPFKTFYAAVIRKDNKGYPANGFQSYEALSRKEALLGMTLWAAKAAFEEKEKGSIEPGKAADFFITSTNLLTCPPDSILKTQVISTYVDGKMVFNH